MKNIDALDFDKSLTYSLSDQSLESLIDLVAQVSWWVSPVVYQSIQIVYPKTRRARGKHETSEQEIDGIRLWENQPANKAFWMAVGKTNDDIKNADICHIYDESAWEPNHFTNLANITAFPKRIASLSEWKPIADVLKYHSYKIYGYTGLTNEIPLTPKYYPELWQHVDNPNEYKTKKIIDKLKDQSTRRPMCRGR